MNASALLNSTYVWAVGLIPVLSGVGMAWIRWRDHVVQLSQRRTRRLHALFVDPTKLKASNSGALEQAAKDAFKVWLRGDEVRYAACHDNPMAMLTALAKSRGLIRLSLDGRSIEDVRRRPWYTYRRLAQIYWCVALGYYVASSSFAMITQGRYPVTVIVLSVLQLVILLPLVRMAMQADAAHRLLDGKTFPFPANARDQGVAPSTASVALDEPGGVDTTARPERSTGLVRRLACIDQ